jgi:hypothetical protein
MDTKEEDCRAAAAQLVLGLAGQGWHALFLVGNDLMILIRDASSQRHFDIPDFNIDT